MSADDQRSTSDAPAPILVVTWPCGANSPTRPTYAVLRPDLATCPTRVQQRRQGDPEDHESFARLHARFADLGDREANVLDATGPPDEVAAALVAAIPTRRLEVIPSPDGVDTTTTATT